MNNNTTCTWQIVHIPDKPPIPPNQQPTVDVFASVIEPKCANILIRLDTPASRLNQIAPFENLRHVKRIRKNHLEGVLSLTGKTQLSVILCLVSEDNSQLNSLPQDVQELSNSYQFANMLQHLKKSGKNSASYGQPHIIHLPSNNIDGITGFSEEDSLSVFSFMKVAIELAKSGDGSIINAAVIVDPSVQQIITNGHDQIFSWHAYANKTCIRNDCIEQSMTLSSHQSNGVASLVTAVLPNTSPSKPESLSYAVSCLNPWKWPEHRLDTANSCYWHPLRHAAIVAIESSADRDRRLFPGLGDTEEKSFETSQSSYVGSLAKRHKTGVANVKEKESDPLTIPSNSVSERPYLCTGCDIYLVWEPCIMCAMALVHQRIRRIFYAFPNPNVGALGSVHRLQGEKSLNHHYAVFRVCVPEEVLGKVGSIKSR
ncbi:unnamed protein product [Dovyalis caffra]|uniref:CMP/dCMP-type deaminase domain-containing protein n=1 Tax=Dovyalis caffra TaxID=77055 RepID=A0AAV1S2Q7_9ROSI|nr:unnamed protein product [Dovyalis caffra]